jgi:ribosomal protein S27AE
MNRAGCGADTPTGPDQDEREVFDMAEYKVVSGRKYVLRFCNHCGETFFARVDRLKDGRGRYCSLSCSAEAQNISSPQHGEANPNWKGGISQNHYHYKKLQVERYPERIAARRAVAAAIRSGKLERQPCEECGATENVQAAHEDYAKPLVVRWLCTTCHAAMDGRPTGRGVDLDKAA